MSTLSESASPTAVIQSLSITFSAEQRTVEAPPGTSILQAARQAGVLIDAPCNERGKCGKCRVRVIAGEAGELSDNERRLLNPPDIDAGIRLACEARPLTSITVEIPETSRNLAHRKATAVLPRPIAPLPFTQKHCVKVAPPSLEKADLRDDLARLRDVVKFASAELFAIRRLHQALVDGEWTVTAVLAGDRLIDIEPGDTVQTHYGLALDIGTTSLVGYLINLATGAEVSAYAQPNPQAAYGADVISRIEFAQGDPAHVETLRTAVNGAINAILRQVSNDAGIDTAQIFEMTVVGNTCMSHLFLGIDPLPLGHAPYTPVITAGQSVTAEALGLAMHPRGAVRTLPNIAGFVGADTVGVLAASDLAARQGLIAAVDIGTNAEVLVSLNGKITACSTAAGPAFEGAKISQGMRAQAGAIDNVTIGEDLFIHTIGEKPPLGICGSGVIDAVGELVRVGIVESSGRFAEPDDLPDLPQALRARLTDDGVVLAWAAESGTGQDIVLTQGDVREIQLVKAAIFAGIATMLAKTGASPESLDGLLIAGAFGTYISPEHALRIGLIPNIPPEKITFLGNAAGTGAKMALLSRDEFSSIVDEASKVGYVELAGDELFRDNFMMAMMLAPGCED